MKRIVSILTLTVVVLAVLTALFFQTAPFLANTFLIPRLVKNFAAEGLTVEIQHLTPWRLTGNIEMGKGSTQSLSLPRVELTYSPIDLMHGRFTSLLLDGAVVQLKRTDRISKQEDTSVARAEGFTLPPLPLTVGKLTLHNCLVSVKQQSHKAFYLAINGSINLGFKPLSQGDFTLVSAVGKLRTSEDLASELQLKLENEGKTSRLHLTFAIPRLADLADFLPSGQTISGQGKLTSTVVLPWNFKSIKQLTANLKFPDLSWNTGSIRLESQASHPLQLSVQGDGKLLHYHLAHVLTSGPHSVAASLNGNIDLVKQLLTGNGTLQAKDLPKPLQLSLTGSRHNRQLDLKLQIKGDEQKLTAGKLPVSLGPFQLTTELRQDAQLTTITQSINIENASLPQQQLQLKNIHARLNLLPSITAGSHMQPGNFAVQKILYHGEDIAGLTAKCKRTAGGFSFDGRIAGRLGAKAVLFFNGTVAKNLPLNMSFRFPKTHFDRNTLPAALALPSDAALAGTIDAGGSLKITPTGTDGRLKIGLDNGSLDLPEKKIHLAGIHCTVDFPHLPEPISAPSQLLTIDRMDINTLRFTNGRIFFRLEDASTLFLEKSIFNWCQGKVETGSMRLSLSKEELSTTLYCDRLQFSQLLTQFGITGTEGKGSLNGRLPVTLSRKGLVFDDGFLFSTPGNNGIVRFNDTTILRQGIAAGARSAVLDYSIQAMQNFAYNWTKLNFNSHNGDLLISMQIDGKPAAPLPYGYQEGQLVHRKNGPGLERPIRLDVNFHLPFAKIFSYGKGFQKLMENIQ